MPKIDERIEQIGAAIVSQATQESKEIIDKANQIREQEIAAYKEQVIEKMFEELQQKTRAVRQKAIRDKAQAELGANRELLLRREELAVAVFAGAKSRLFDYVATPAYRAALLQELAALADQYDHSDSIVLLREADMALADDIQKLLPGCQVQADPFIRLGGFMLRNRAAGVLVDETLDARLKAQRPWFLQNSGLTTI